MYVPPPDRTLGEQEWRPWLERQGFGQLVSAGPGPDGWPVIVPTQFVFEGTEVLAHVAAANPILDALAADPRAVLSVAGDWAFIPSDWKALPGEDPVLGIPTTYYAAVQLRGRVTVLDQPAGLLRRQLAALQPDTAVADPAEAHPAKLRAIRGLVLTIEDVVAKWKFGGNVDDAHRRAVATRLDERDGPGDRGAVAHLRRRSGAGG